MPLSPGTRIGAYEVTALLGEGGMGEVYRATDPKLKREVAIKVLPASVAQDAERLARFAREAEVLAQLNHPHIAQIYGFEESGTTTALVMELVEGPTLGDRIARGPLPLDEALAIARQIAEALEAAHERGIIHRDLKPANIKVRDDGTVKVLDFGLAKALQDPKTSGPQHLANSPTITSPAMTAAGIILGTAAYMSPEQARGRAVDKRTDIWAFGCVLYEALTGKRAFEGENVADLLGNVIQKEPALSALPPDTPWRVRDVVARCLRKDPRERMQDIADARLELGESGPADAPPRPSAMPRRLALGVAVSVGLGIGAGIAVLAVRPTGEQRDAPVSRFVIPLPPDAPLVVMSYPGRSLALSPDGTQIAYATADSLSDTRFHVRRLDETGIRSIPGSEKGRAPFFSPDGEWLAYFDPTESALKKISVRGGRAVTLERGFPNAGYMLGGWCDDGRIVFDTWNDGLRVVGGDGGNPRVLTEPTDEWHLDPQPLPGPCRVLFHTYRDDGYAIEAISVDGGERTRILDNASHARYLASGHLLFVRDGALHVAPFDIGRLKVTGPANPLPIEVVFDSVNGSAPTPQLAVSPNGTLVYADREGKVGSEPRLVAVTHDGQVEELGPLPFPRPLLTLSPDGERLALSGRSAGRARIEALDLKRQATTRLVDLGRVDAPTAPIWSPDGRSILYGRYGPVEAEIVRHPLDGSAADEVLVRVPGTYITPWSLSPDGRYLLFSRFVPETAGDLLLFDFKAESRAAAVRPFVATPGADDGAAIAPNGEWFAYNSDESGRFELLIEKFPQRGQKTRVWSGDRADSPVWSRDGREIYFAVGNAGGRGGLSMMAARVEFTPTLRVGEPRQLFSGPFLRGADAGATVSIAPDRRFLMARNPEGAEYTGRFFGDAATQLVVVQNWLTELRRLQGETAR